MGRTEVAVGLIFDRLGRVCISQRVGSSPSSGFWEFPGGKVEPGETALEALSRELQEELSIRVLSAFPWVSLCSDFCASVQLRFFKVVHWEGALCGREGQPVCWQPLAGPWKAPFLPANAPILRWLKLPRFFLLLPVAKLESAATVQQQLARLSAFIAQYGPVILRIRGQFPLVHQSMVHCFVSAARQAGALVVMDAAQLHDVFDIADGVHLCAQDLKQAISLNPVQAARPWCFASCHTLGELHLAQARGVDAVLLGSVLKTPSHPSQEGLGWQKAADLLRQLDRPVYLLGGLGVRDWPLAAREGAHGVALMRQW